MSGEFAIFLEGEMKSDMKVAICFPGDYKKFRLSKAGDYNENTLLKTQKKKSQILSRLFSSCHFMSL
jgi:hypothetical protein